MDGFAVTPRQLAEAADTITAALRDGAVARPPALTAGGACGHDELASAVAEFGSAVQLAAAVLVSRAEQASAGLCADADAYGRQDGRAAAALTGPRAAPDVRPAPDVSAWGAPDVSAARGGSG
jgi:hypothetical protein